jgi:hypothetical protein
LDKNGNPYNAAYIHFAEWYNTNYTEVFQKRVTSQLKTHIVHDSPWYWIALENKTKKYIPGMKKICINLTSSSEEQQVVDCQEQQVEYQETDDKSEIFTEETYFNSLSKQKLYDDLYDMEDFYLKSEKEISNLKYDYEQTFKSILACNTIEEAKAILCKKMFNEHYVVNQESNDNNQESVVNQESNDNQESVVNQESNDNNQESNDNNKPIPNGYTLCCDCLLFKGFRNVISENIPNGYTLCTDCLMWYD